MKNIIKIFLNDFKKIKTNVVAVVIIIGLAILPCLYAWFNILSNWDPYGEDATSRIKVAVASDDEGVTIDDTYFNMGDEVISALEANTTIGWVFTDTTQEAIDGVYSGEYYAALVMPEDFTSDMISFLSDDMEHPEITYYENEKKNAIAPKITSKAKTAVQQQVNATFISTLAEVLTQTADAAMDTEGLQALITVLGDLYYIGIQCQYPVRFWLVAATPGFVFSLFMYSLTVAFGNIGEALSIIVMVIQVAGAGGTFPLEVLPEVYQNLYHYLPFPYAMDAFKETIGGLYDNYYRECLGHLLLYVPVSVVIGLVCGVPFEKFNRRIEENKEHSGVML